jgi:hypothetical protein
MSVRWDLTAIARRASFIDRLVLDSYGINIAQEKNTGSTERHGPRRISLAAQQQPFLIHMILAPFLFYLYVRTERTNTNSIFWLSKFPGNRCVVHMLGYPTNVTV